MLEQASGGQESHAARVAPRARPLLTALGVSLGIGGCGGPTSAPAASGPPHPGFASDRGAPEAQADSHLWDTEDPGAGAPTSSLLAVALGACALYVVLRLIRRRRDSGPFRLSDARRTQIVVRHRPRSPGERPGEERPNATPFPQWVSESRLVETILRIANDPTSYLTRELPTAPGLHVAQVGMLGPNGDGVVVKVVVDAADHEIVAVHPGTAASFDEEAVPESLSRVAAQTGTSLDRPMQAVRGMLEEACAALPADAAAHATENPHHPDSIGNLAYARELMDQDEFEVALYAVATIAREVHAGPECWTALTNAARELRFDARQRARASLL